MYNYFKFKDDLERTAGYLEHQNKQQHWEARHQGSQHAIQMINSTHMRNMSARSRILWKRYDWVECRPNNNLSTAKMITLITGASLICFGMQPNKRDSRGTRHSSIAITGICSHSQTYVGGLRIHWLSNTPICWSISTSSLQRWSWEACSLRDPTNRESRFGIQGRSHCSRHYDSAASLTSKSLLRITYPKISLIM